MKHMVVVILCALSTITPATWCIYNKTHFVIDQSGNPVKDAQLSQGLDSIERPREKKNSSYRVFFSPNDDVRARLIDLINHEKKSIKVSIFMFTDKDIAHALISAAQRNVQVAVIVDGAASADRFSKIEMLKRSGIDVFEYKPQAPTGINNDIMHHKFVIFGSNQDDCSLLWTGSCNFTRSASVRNRENVIVLDDTGVIEQFEQEFERLKQIIKKSSSMLHLSGRSYPSSVSLHLGPKLQLGPVRHSSYERRRKVTQDRQATRQVRKASRITKRYIRNNEIC